MTSGVKVFKIETDDAWVYVKTFENDSVWQDTLRYLTDADVKFTVEEFHGVPKNPDGTRAKLCTPAEASDEISPGDH